MANLEFQLDPDEAKRARHDLSLAFVGYVIRSDWWLAAVPLAASFLFGWLIAASLRSAHDYVFDAIQLGITAVGAEAIFLVGFLAIQRRATAPGIWTISVGDNSLVVDGPRLCFDVPWLRVRKIAETAEFFTAYASFLRAVVIPKRAVPDEAAQRLRDIQFRKDQEVSRAFAEWGRRFPF